MTGEPARILEGRTVLVVDDEPSVRRSTARLLERAGAEVLEASCAEDALAYGRDEGRSIDVLLSDMVMPGAGAIDPASAARDVGPDAGTLLTSPSPPRALPRHKLTDE